MRISTHRYKQPRKIQHYIHRRLRCANRNIHVHASLSRAPQSRFRLSFFALSFSRSRALGKKENLEYNVQQSSLRVERRIYREKAVSQDFPRRTREIVDFYKSVYIRYIYCCCCAGQLIDISSELRESCNQTRKSIAALILCERDNTRNHRRLILLIRWN